MNARRSLKRAAELALLHGGVAAWSRSRRRGDALILAYHNIVPRGSQPLGDRSLHLPQDQFAAQLDVLRDTHDVVAVADLLTVPASSGARPRVAITFDDAYRGAVTAGVAELAQRGLPATLFVAPALLDDAVFWWDAITPEGESGPVPAERVRALTRLEGVGARVVSDATAAGRPIRAMPAFARGASVAELMTAAETPGIVLGSHSWSHPNLAVLDPDALREELERPLAWLRDHRADVLPWLAYPYGLSTPAVHAAARAAGYEAGLRIAGGWLRAAADPFALPRLDVPSGLSLEGFRLRAAGLLR